MPSCPPYDISSIQSILPHRSPFLFVDRVLQVDLGDKLIAEKDLDPDAPFFSGHFPGRPIMPGVLIAEALAQTSGFLLGFTWKERGFPLNANLFLASINVKFTGLSGPGDILQLEASLKKEYGGIFAFNVAAYVAGRQVAKGSLMLAKEEKL